ncbi:MAG TPA: cytochrome b N-terminal domain-containing protein [Mariprofundaceae bacterium]|nr:cytochrome b N-terminal domain-containing protein [Mariprofundaceae bacterium]
MIERMLNTRLAGWIDERTNAVSFIRYHLIDYPTPKSLNYWWAFGSIALVILIIQIVTGLFLAMNYKASTVATGGGFTVAFDSVERIMRDVNYGWLIRYMHAVGASSFFFVIYLHMARGIYYGSYKGPREVLWLIGVALFLIMQSTVFFGYLLPWGQLSYWGATVITNIFGATPVIGPWLTELVRGGFSVGDPTLTRFFALHFLFPLVLFAIVILHVLALHKTHSNNPTGVEQKSKKSVIPFHPYYTVKDLFGIGVFLIIFAYFVFYNPTGFGYFMETDNFSPANPLHTPGDISPVWYLTPWYEILRMIPSKTGGILALNLAFILLFLLPWLDRSPVRAATYRPVFRQMVWLFFVAILVMGYCGHHPVTPVYNLIGRIAGGVYFGFFLLLPFVHKFENPKPLPEEEGA